MTPLLNAVNDCGSLIRQNLDPLDTSQGRSRRTFLRSSLLGTLLPSFAGRLFAQPTAGDEFRRLFNPATRQAISDGLAYLASQQNQDGSFGTEDYRRNVAVCGLCLMRVYRLPASQVCCATADRAAYV